MAKDLILFRVNSIPQESGADPQGIRNKHLHSDDLLPRKPSCGQNSSFQSALAKGRFNLLAQNIAPRLPSYIHQITEPLLL